MARARPQLIKTNHQADRAQDDDGQSSMRGKARHPA